MATAAARLRLIRRTLTGAEWARLGGFASFILFLHLAGWLTLALLVAPKYAAVGLGTGLTAYTFGLRHAFDADHISAIDNTTRKFMADGKRPLGVGFFFSLGHSSIVFGLAVGLAFAARTVAGQVSDSSQLKNFGGYIGTGVSGLFLYLIAALNVVVLVGIVRVFRDMRRGHYDEFQLEQKLQERGFMNRFLGPIARSVKHSWQMYFVGLLFGLGFDTATEVGLLALAAGAASTGLPWYAVLCLPVLFAAGMCLMDTADGAFMTQAYGWAFAKPVRKVFYNITITGLSVAVAFLIGTIELLQILVQYFSLSGGAWDLIANLNLNTMGIGIVVVFFATWVIALSVWRLGRIEERWALAPAGPQPAPLPPAD
ncbi:MAG TPA: HoxN/HupN/NixA family nickel/cobalt transporter [Candidatus Dormibacteraeota bacterium]|nr:HoxN/HupN/NixA family nickel/cobalt transporter [Candidatus Dormibacteraeota bacterium]